MRNHYLVFGAPEITSEDIEAVLQTFKTGWIGTGPVSTQFEHEFAQYTGSPHALALSSCTAALHLAMLTSGIKPGDEVITTPMTFCATANAIVHAGGIPIFADIHPQTGLIDPNEILKKITPKTKAIIPVHLAGRACQMNEILDIAQSNNLVVIEDCAHAIETLYHNQHAGTLGDAGCFSFYVTKNVVGIEGGMLLTPHQSVAQRVKTLALNGMSADAWSRFSDQGYKHYQVTEVGYKYNLPDVHAALALSQLRRIEVDLKRRKTIWHDYNKAFNSLPCWIPPEPEPNTRHARHLYTLLLDLEKLKLTRDQFLMELHNHNIGSGVHYISLHLHRYYQDIYGYKPKDYPNSKWHSDRTVSLPLSTKLTQADLEDVKEAVVTILNKYKK